MGFLTSALEGWSARVGVFIVAIAVLIAVFAPLIAPEAQNALTNDMMVPPGASHLMGTDDLGHDNFSQLVWGTRTSLMFGFGVTVLSLIIGAILGSIPGYYGGWVDHLFSRIFEIFLMIPNLFLIILLAALFGQSLWIAAIVVSVTVWPSNARLIRAETLSVRAREFVEAARGLGASNTRIIFRHIAPNTIQPVVVNSTLQMAGAILIEASLSFLGLGDPNVASWGQMLNRAQPYLATNWWLAVFPGFAISLLVVGVTLCGEGINHALSSQRTRRRQTKREALVEAPAERAMPA